jgi:hypothetical protein
MELSQTIPTVRRGRIIISLSQGGVPIASLGDDQTTTRATTTACPISWW